MSNVEAQSVPSPAEHSSRKIEKKESGLVHPEAVVAAARQRIQEATKGLDAEAGHLATQWMRMRAEFDAADGRLDPASVRSLQTQLRRLHEQLAAHGVSLEKLGIPDADGVSQQLANEAGRFLQANIHIEYTPGMRRNGNIVRHPYGCIPLITDKDHEYLDVFLGPQPKSDTVFVLEQISQDLPATSDGGPRAHITDTERKCLVGFQNEDAARKAYLENYPAGWKAGPITAVPVAQFSGMLKKGAVSV